MMRRVLAGAAILGGGLRIVGAFASGKPEMLALLYLATDIALLLGAAGLWRTRRGGIAGMIGIAVFALGILTIRFGFYTVGAPVALIGLALWSVEALFKGARVAPVLWLAALAAGAAQFAVAAGVLFGLGFIVAGASMIYGWPQSAQTATSTVT
jgi:hypothetical protein